jgi:hypothetical protein
MEGEAERRCFDYMNGKRAICPDCPMRSSRPGNGDRSLSPLLFFYTVYVMNRHLRAQWGYESKLLAMIFAHEGVKSVKRFKIEYDEDDLGGRPAGRFIKVKRMLRRLVDEI